jgi:hypothetical protein
VTVNTLPSISVVNQPACSTDLSTWSLSVSLNTGTLTSTAGTLVNNGGNNWSVSGIPAGTNITLTATASTASASCRNTLEVTAPNCSCPSVPAPVSGGNKTYCSIGSIVSISATVASGFTVDWYNLASGGTLLANGTSTFNPTNPGTYYAQARSLSSGCTSSSRTAVSVTPVQAITPTFAAIGPLCQNSVAPTLPTSSTNIPAITGTWNAAISTSNAGTTVYTFTPTAGQCATTGSLAIAVIQTQSTTERPSICANQSYTLPDGRSVSTANTYTSLIPNGNGCNNIVTTILTVNPVYNLTVNASIPSGGSYTLPDGSTVNTAGTFPVTLRSKNGCDITVVTKLSIFNPG